MCTVESVRGRLLWRAIMCVAGERACCLFHLPAAARLFQCVRVYVTRPIITNTSYTCVVSFCRDVTCGDDDVQNRFNSYANINTRETGDGERRCRRRGAERMCFPFPFVARGGDRALKMSDAICETSAKIKHPCVCACPSYIRRGITPSALFRAYTDTHTHSTPRDTGAMRAPVVPAPGPVKMSASVSPRARALRLG